MRAGANAVANVCFQRVLTGTTPATRRLDLRRSKSVTDYSFFRVTIRFRREYAANSVDHVSLVAINNVSIRGLHFEAITCGPRAAAQHPQIATSWPVVAFIIVETLFPNVPAQIE